MKLLHTMVRVKDIKESLKFYTELFDLNVARELRLEDCNLYFLSDNQGDVQIELTYNDKTPEKGYEIGTGFGHFAFEVHSFDEFTKKLISLGYGYVYEPFKLPGHELQIAFVKDPDGYEIELVESK